MMTKKIFAVMLAVAFTLGAASLGFSEEAKGAAGDTNFCSNTNCCGDQAGARKDGANTKKTDENKWKEFNENVRGG